MKSLFFISIILLNLYVGNVDAQTLKPYTVDQNKDSLFHKTIGYLHKKSVFYRLCRYYIRFYQSKEVCEK